MKRVIAFFVRNGLFADLLTVGVIAIGLVSMFLIRREVFPNVTFDVISVSTIFPGGSPEEVEKLVTNPIEQEIQEVDGIKKVLSFSMEGRSGVVVYLDPDQTTGPEGKREIEDALSRVTDLPSEAEDPMVTELESKQGPIIEVSLAGENMDELELRKVAKDLEREIERIPGVARVVHKGLRDVEIRVEVSRDKLSFYRLSLEDVIRALRNQNLSIPGGSIRPNDPNGPTGQSPRKEKIVRTVGDFSGLKDIEQTVIRANDLGQSIMVKDVAKVFYDLEKATYLFRTKGIPSLGLTILKKEKADAIHLVENVKKRLDEIKPNLDPNIKISYVNDMSEYIQRRLSILTNNLSIGFFLILIILPLIIPFKFSMLIALGIPFAFLGAMGTLYYLGASINLVSLLGLIIVSGMLVDDAIVVTENAVRLIEEEGLTPKEAAIVGTYQILPPLCASVFTTAMAFLPMMFMSGIFGKFIREIPLAVLACLGVSLFESILILPAHITHWIKVGSSSRRKASNDPEQSSEVQKLHPLRRLLWTMRNFWDDRVVPTYGRLLTLSLRFRYLVITGMVALGLLTIVVATKGMRFILFPPEGIENFFIRVESPVGSSLEQTAENLKILEKFVAELPAEELDTYTTSVGIQQQDPHDPNTKRGSEYGQVTVYLTPENNRVRTAAEIINDLRQKIGLPPQFTRIVYDRVNPGPPMGKPVSLGVRAENYQDILKVTQELKEMLKNLPGVHDIGDSYILGKEEIQVGVKPKEAAAAFLSVATIGNTVRASFEGIVATTVRSLNEKTDVRVSLPKSERSQIISLEEILVPNPMGHLIPLGNVATFKPAQNLSNYQHEDYRREVKVTAEIDTNVTTSTEVNNKIRSLLPPLRQKYPMVSVDFGGEDEDTQESLDSLKRSFLLAMLGVFLILVLIFKQLLQPMLVLITIPLGIISVIWAFFLHGMPLSFMCFVGAIALGGIIVNNAIVLVDFVNKAREEGQDRRESIISSAKIRLRPIFLTTVTTVVGVLPTAYGVGGLDKFVVPIAMSLGWGLMFGSLLTAFIFPSALAIMDDLAGLIQRKFPRLANLHRS